MKKQLTILVVLLWAVLGLKAQQNGIVYMDFNPDLCVEELSPYDSHDTLKIDLDQDGTTDFKMFIESEHSTQLRHVYVTSSWDFRYCYNNIYSYGYMDENDTIIPNHSIWAPANSTWELLWSDYGPYMEFIMGFRKTVDEDNYYAWAKIYMYRNVNGNGYAPGPGEFDIVSAYCDDMAFCTVPNYPLVWGQTEIENYILYTGFEPDTCFTFQSLSDTLKLDLDQDGTGDIVLYTTWNSSVPGYLLVHLNTPAADWQWSWVNANDFTPLTNTTIISGDLLWQDNPGEPGMYSPVRTHYAFRHQTEEGYMYGWAHIQLENITTICVSGMAYCIIPDYPLQWGQTQIDIIGEEGAEWFYEIKNEDGSITYQHLQCAGDTAVGGQRPKIIVRSNTQYDKDVPTEVTHEYVYEENGIVYWWNKDLEEFTTLYNLIAETGDEWTIKVGNDSLIMHVDGVGSIEYEGRTFRTLQVSDSDNLFSGDILCGIGHMTSFFPERLMHRDDGYTVDGLRCYWVEDALVYHNGDEDCDAIYSEIHGIEEDGPSTGSGAVAVYPNPANNFLFVETVCTPSLPDPTYRVTNLMGQTLLQGNITTENQQIDISSLPSGMYFISMGGQTAKFVKQ